MLQMLSKPMSGMISLYVMAVVYIAAGVNHFLNPAFYVRIMPPYLPYHLPLVYISGAVEVVLGVSLLFPATRSLAAWGIILMLIAFVPVHIYMLQADKFQHMAAWMLWARLALQGLLIYWAYQFV